jgi:hypothetical protein
MKTHTATPGPYRAYQSFGNWFVRSESMGTVVASVYVGAPGVPRPEVEATARLLAAAPRMQDELRRVLEDRDGPGDMRARIRGLLKSLENPTSEGTV